MNCPFCGRQLKAGELRRYETLIDHVSDPNREYYPLRETWVCDCNKSHGLFWDWFGDVYSLDFRADILDMDSRAIKKGKG